MQLFLMWNFSDPVSSKALLIKQYFKNIFRLKSEKKKKKKKKKKNIEAERKLWYLHKKCVLDVPRWH